MRLDDGWRRSYPPFRLRRWWPFGWVGRHSAFKSHHQSDPSFLFSTWPIPEYRDGVVTVVLSPSGGDDTPLFNQASARLYASGGGVMRFAEGDFKMAAPLVWVRDG